MRCGPQLPERCVVDGEVVIAGDHGLDFDALSQRIHPAASRVTMLARETPASFVAFDLLAVGERDLRETPFFHRRAELEGVLAGVEPPIHLTPLTGDPGVAREWFERFEGAGLDGVVAKPSSVALSGRAAGHVEGQARAHRETSSSPGSGGTRRTPRWSAP